MLNVKRNESVKQSIENEDMHRLKDFCQKSEEIENSKKNII